MGFGSFWQRIGQMTLPLTLVAALALAVLLKPRWLIRLLSSLEAMCRECANWCEQRALDILSRKGIQERPSGTSTLRATGETGETARDAVDRVWGSMFLDPRQQSLPSGERAGFWAGAKLLAQLLWSTFAACLLSAMLLIDTGRSCAVQGGGEDCTILLPFGLSFGVINGVLWAVTLAYFGGIFIEGIGWVADAHLHLYPDLGAKARRLLTIYAGIGVSLSLVAVSLLYVVSAMQLIGMQWPEATIAVALLQALLINGAAFAAVPSLIAGVGALVALLCSVGALLSSTCAHLCALLRHLIGSPAPGIAGATADGWSEEYGFTHDGEDSMSSERAKHIWCLGVGHLATTFAPLLVTHTRGYSGGKVKLWWGAVNPKRPQDAPLRPADPLDVSVMKHDFALAAQMRRDPQQQEQLILQKQVRNLMEPMASSGYMGGDLYAICDSSYVPQVVDILQSFSADCPNVEMCLIVLPPQFNATGQDTQVDEQDSEWMDALEHLPVRAGRRTCPLILAERSPAATRNREEWGPTRQLIQFAGASGQAIAASLQDPRQRTLIELLQQIGQVAPYCAMATSSDSVPLGKRVTFIEWVRRAMGRRAVGYGDVTVMCGTVLRLAEQVHADVTLCSADVPLEQRITTVSGISATTPLQRSDRRYSEQVSTIEHGLPQVAEGITTLLTEGNGLPDRKLSSAGLYVQVTSFIGFDIKRPRAAHALELSASVEDSSAEDSLQHGGDEGRAHDDHEDHEDQEDREANITQVTQVHTVDDVPDSTQGHSHLPAAPSANAASIAGADDHDAKRPTSPSERSETNERPRRRGVTRTQGGQTGRGQSRGETSEPGRRVTHGVNGHDPA